jgi:sugar-specific transcriptional regulator TrmB
MKNLNKELLTKTLMTLGLTEIDSKIYLLLAKEGPQYGKSIAEMLNLYKQQLYRSLRRLRNMRIIKATPKRPAHFSAFPLDIVLDTLIDAKKEQALALQASRKELLSTWRIITGKDTVNS